MIFGKSESESGSWEGTAGVTRPQAAQRTPASPTGVLWWVVTYPAQRLVVCLADSVGTKRRGYRVPFVPDGEFFKKLFCW